MTRAFIDLGAGWFLFDDEERRCSWICDSRSMQPDRQFGPAAWVEASGPISGKTSFVACPVIRGSWEQTGSEEWKWCSEDGSEYDVPLASWPRSLEIKDDSLLALCHAVAGRVFKSQEELVGALRAILKSQPVRDLLLSSTADRLELAKAWHGQFDQALH